MILVIQMKAIVTGGCGFIGSNLVEYLDKNGWEVTVFDNLSLGTLDNIRNMNVKCYTCGYEQMINLAPEADVVFHLGMPSSSPMYKEDPSLVGKTINDAITIFEYARKKKCSIIYASTSSIYNGNPTPYREDMPIYVTDYYTECRYAIERIAKLYNTLYDVKSVGLRLFSVYGPKEKHKGKYANLVSQFLWSIMKDEPPIIYGDGTQTRDFIHVYDVVKAFILAYEGNFTCEIFNVGTGISHTINEVVEIINKLLRKNIKPKYIPNPVKNYVHHTLADTTKAEKTLGFKAKIQLEEGIRHLISIETTSHQ